MHPSGDWGHLLAVIVSVGVGVRVRVRVRVGLGLHLLAVVDDERLGRQQEGDLGEG